MSFVCAEEKVCWAAICFVCGQELCVTMALETGCRIHQAYQDPEPSSSSTVGEGEQQRYVIL